MSDDLIGRGVVEVVGNTDDVTAKIAKVGDDVEKMARRAQKAGKDASDGIKQLGDGAKGAGDGIDEATRKFEAGLKKQIAAMAGAKRGTEEYVRAQAKLKGADIAALEPVIKQWSSVKRSADEAAASTKRFAESQRFLSNLSAQTAGIGKTASQLAALKAEQLGVAKEAAPMIAKLEQAERAANKTGGAFSQLGGYIKAAVAAFGIREIVRYADSWTELQNRLRLVTGSQAELAGATEDVYRIAKTTNQELAATGEVYQRFAQNAETLGISQAKVAEVTETVSKAVAVSGASAQAAQAALTQFGQALAAGVFRGDEFNSVMEQTPALAQAIARGIGVTTGELRKMAAEGKLTGDVLIDALSAARDSVDEQFNTRVKTLGQSFTNLQTSVARYIGELNTSSGVTSTFGAVIEAVADNIDTLASAATTLIALKVHQWMATSTAATLGFSGAVKAATVAVRTFFASLGPIGWAVLAVGTLATAWQAFSDKIEGSKQIARTFGAAWDATKTVVVDGFQSIWDVASKFFGLAQDKPREVARDMGQAFQDGVIAVAEAIDSLHQNVTGTMAAVGAVFLTVAENMETVFKNAFHRVLELASEWVHDLATQLNKLPGVNIETSLYVGPGNLKTKNVLEEARKAFESGKQSFGLADSVRNNIEARAWATLYEGMADSAGKAGQAVKALGEETDNTKKKVSDAQKAAQQFEQQRRAYLRSQYQEISNLNDQAAALEDQVRYYGLSESALNDLTIARLEEQKAALMGFEGAEEEIAIRERMIEQYQRIGVAMSSLEQKEAQKASWEEWARDVEQIFQQVGQSLTDALFEGGKSARDLIKDLFKTLTLRVFIQPMMGQLQGWVTNSLGGMFGYQNPQQGGGSSMPGMAQNAYSGYNAATGGLSGTLGNAAQWLGNQVGSQALHSFGLGLSGATAATGIASIGAGLGASLGTTIGTSAAAMATTTFSATLGGGAAAAGGAAAGGAAGLGAAFGAALPWVGGALAVGSLLGGLFGDSKPKTRHEQRNQIEYTGGAFDIARRDDRQAAGTAEAARTLAEQAVRTANQVFQQVGIDAAIESFTALMASSVLGDRDGVASGGKLRIGTELRDIGVTNRINPSLSGFGGWSSEEMLPRLATDIQMSILEAYQQAGVLSDMLSGINIRGLDSSAAEQLATSVQAIVQDVFAFRAAIESLPFENLRDLSFDAAANLLQLAGGFESLAASQQAYYAAFYTQAEQADILRGMLTKSLADIHLALPQSLAQYRALVESLDLTTEAGRQTYVTLMQLAPQFAQLTEAAKNVASELAASIMKGVGTDIDFDWLSTALADVDTDGFVATITQVFERLGERITRLIDGIGAQREAVELAREGIINAGPLTPEQIIEQIRGINTLLPSNTGVSSAASRLSAAESLAEQRRREELAALNAYTPARTAYDAAVGQVPGLESRQSELQAQIQSYEAQIAIPRKYIEGRAYVRNLQAQMPGLYEELGQVSEALNAARAASSGGRWNEIASLSAQYSNAVAASASAQSAATEAAKRAKAEQLAYAKAIQQFAIESAQSASKLGQLREETLRYYEAQQALANLMSNSADALRQRAYDFRFSQLDPEDQFRQLQSEFGKAYSMALSTTGETLVGYGDKLNELVNPMLTAAQNMFASDAQYNSFVAQTLARVEAIAGRLDSLAPQGYEEQSLAVLAQIDQTLLKLEGSARAADQIIAGAVTAGTDAIVNGLRQIANALTGKSVAAFASGGLHTGGLRIVGERGPELELTGPSRIFSAEQTRRILSGGNGSAEMVSELRALRDELANLRAESRATASHTAKTARQLERMEIDGMLIRTDADTPIQAEVVA